MAIQFDKLPYDANGIAQGAWRVLHRDPDFSGELGPAIFSKGASVFPVAGRPLRLLAAHFGGDLYLEPWGDAPTNGWMLPPCVLHDVPEGIDWTPEPCPWRVASEPAAEPAPPVAETADTDPPPAPEASADVDAADDSPNVAEVGDLTPNEPAQVAKSDDLDDMSKDSLRAFAADCGIECDGRWGEDRLRAEIRAALS